MTRTAPRDQRSRLARQTVTACEQGWYETATGRRVDFAGDLARAVEGTVEYPPDAEPPAPPRGRFTTRVTVVNAGTFDAAAELAASGNTPVALNFASAKNPGGGFLNGAQAQEEELARSSALYPCIGNAEMYRINRACRDPLYTDAMIYSPAVPVLRTTDGEWLETPWNCSIITAPAPNAGVALRRDPGAGPRITQTLRRRAVRVLTVAAANGHRDVVLGAWGCGVFRNDPEHVAQAFESALRGPFRGVFEQVVFAVLAPGGASANLRVFQRVFGTGASLMGACGAVADDDFTR